MRQANFTKTSLTITRSSLTLLVKTKMASRKENMKPSYKFIFCTKSNKYLIKNMPVAEALASAHHLVFSLAILANLTRCLAEATAEKIDLHQKKPLWVFQLWL